jgi:hypothetical protein
MRSLLLLLAVSAFGQGNKGTVRITGEFLPLPPMRSPRIEWLEPAETYTERVMLELSLRILALETKVAFLQMLF